MAASAIETQAKVATPFMREERETVARFLPGLESRLRSVPLGSLEVPNNPGLGIYRDRQGPGLLISKEHGGLGASALEAIHVHRMLGSLSPSLSIAVTMHNFSVATLLEYSFYAEHSAEFLRQIAADQLYLASGFAEGRTGTNIMIPTVTARPVEGGYLVNGSKKPCCLTYSMHLLTAGVGVKNESTGSTDRAVAIIPADAEGIDRRAFWKNAALAGAESDELILKDVFVPQEYLFFPERQSDLDAVETGGFLWFELLVSASYLGMASALVERLLASGKGNATERTRAVIEVEGGMVALEGVARAMMVGGPRTADTLARCLMARYAVQGAIERATSLAAELLGGMAFIGGTDVSYLVAASRGLAFHPPSRVSVASALDAYLAGDPLHLV